MKKDTDRTVLVAVVKSPRDLKLALERHWYRVPVKSAPPILRDFSVRYIAFYQNRSFGKEGFQVRWYGEVDSVKIVKRKELFAKERTHPRANEPYFKIGLQNLQMLPQPIISRRKRPIVFIPTTPTKLLHATEINDLFSESPLEDALWDTFKVERIPAERQYFIGKSPYRFALDFALFCKKLNLDVECDGDTYHANPMNMRKDRKRNNVLASLGWQVMRFGKDDITKRKNNTVLIIKETINELGGIEVEERPGQYRTLPVEKVSQPVDIFSEKNT